MTGCKMGGCKMGCKILVRGVMSEDGKIGENGCHAKDTVALQENCSLLADRGGHLLQRHPVNNIAAVYIQPRRRGCRLALATDVSRWPLVGEAIARAMRLTIDSVR